MLVNAEKLKRLRIAKNWTQQQLADQSLISLRTVQRVEKHGVASHDTVAAYSAVFDVPPAEFLINAEQFEQTMSSSQLPSLVFLLLGFILGCVATFAINTII